MTWQLGDIIDTIIPLLPEGHKALVHGDRVISWQELDKRSNNLARNLLEGGAAYGDKVGFYMRNRPEYMELLTACFRGRLTHVNVNYRYVPDEVHYIFDNSDATVVVYGAEFRANIEELRPRLPKVKQWIEIDGNGSEPDGVMAYETLVEKGTGENLDIERNGEDDFLFLYTGGTTGMPKGVMWDHHNLREAQSLALRAMGAAPDTLDELKTLIKQMLATTGTDVIIPACPLMHGTGLFTAMGVFLSGGTVVTLEASSLKSDELWRAVDKEKVTNIAIVGDAFAKPMLKELEDAPTGTYDLSSINIIVSSGVMWSQEVKQAMLEYIPQANLVDSFGSSEAIGFGSSSTTKDTPVKTAKFTTNELCKVFDENDNEIAWGSDTPGFIAFGGPIPRGYYKDEEKTAKTFKTINGQRYSIPGDYCLVSPEGELTLLGRGSVCINSAGEKIYPEEVEESLKLHEAVEDALVVGVPDEKWGQAVTAVVKLNTGFEFNDEELKAFVRSKLAAYKTPKHIFTDGPPFRAPNGKADYKSVGEFALAQVKAPN